MAGKITIIVEAGQCFRVPRAGKPARHLRIFRVSRAFLPPRAWCVEVSRNGRKKPGEMFCHTLTFQDGRWCMGPGFEEVDLAGAATESDR